MKNVVKGALALAAVSSLAFGGAAIAGAAEGNPTNPSSTSFGGRLHLCVFNTNTGNVTVYTAGNVCASTQHRVDVPAGQPFLGEARQEFPIESGRVTVQCQGGNQPDGQPRVATGFGWDANGATPIANYPDNSLSWVYEFPSGTTGTVYLRCAGIALNQ